LLIQLNKKRSIPEDMLRKKLPICAWNDDPGE